MSGFRGYCLGYGAYFGRVTDLGSRAVEFDVLGIEGFETRSGVCAPYEPLLGIAVGKNNPGSLDECQ
jgi:hypothetical protein